MLGCVLWSIVVLPNPAGAVTPAPALTDREIVERLTRLETRLDEGLTGLRAEMVQLRADMQAQNRQLRAEMVQLRADMQAQNRQLREDMNIRFEEHSRLILGILAAFAALFVINVPHIFLDTLRRIVQTKPLEYKKLVA